MTDTTDAPPRRASLRSQMRAGVIFWGIGTAVSRSFRFVAQYVLLWLLVPEDFGLVAMTTALMNVLQMVSDFGVGVAVIQKKDLTDTYISTAFWTNLAASLIILAVAWISAPWIAGFYGAPEIVNLVRVTSLSFPVMALRTIPMGLLRRRMQFGVNSAIDAAWSAASGILMIVFAAMGAAYWSLVIPSIIVGVLVTPVWFIYAKWWPTLRMNRDEFVELFHYSKHLIGASLLALVLNNAGFVIAGHVLGTNAAGLYNVAATYSMVVLINYAYLIGNVSLSGFAARQDSPDVLMKGFTRIYELLAASTLPIHALGIALSPLIFASVIPAEYRAACVAFQALLACMAVRSIAAHVAPFFNAVNKAHLNLYFYIVSTPLCIAAMYWACTTANAKEGAQAGLNALAWATALPQILSVIALLALMRTALGWRNAGLVRILVPYAFATGIAVAAAKAIEYALLAASLPNLVILILATATGSAAYLLALYAGARHRLALLLHDVLPRTIRERYLMTYLPSLCPAAGPASDESGIPN